MKTRAVNSITNDLVTNELIIVSLCLFRINNVNTVKDLQIKRKALRSRLNQYKLLISNN
jgi:DNA-binding NtrC family response regulator